MAAPTNHWKLGLFVVLGAMVAMGALVLLGARTLQKQTVRYKTFFDESVQGLEVGSPVKFRGVTIGNVSVIDVAPDHREVEVTCELGVTQLDELGLNVPRFRKAHIAVPPDLRVQLASAGITGVKFILIDFFPIENNPVPRLPFAVPENYIPSTPSTMKNLEDAVVKSVDSFPKLLEQIVVLLAKVSHIMEDVNDEHLPQKMSVTLAKLDRVLTSVDSSLTQLDAPKLSAKAQDTLTSLNGTMTQMNHLLDRLQGEKGLLTSMERASNGLGDLTRGASGLGPELEETLRDVQEAAGAIQKLGAELDRDSDMLLKGRSKVRP